MEKIVRYSYNRKLYSKKESKYVNSEYIADLVKTDQNFQIVDSKSGDDKTAGVLAEYVAKNLNDVSKLKQLIKEL